MILAGDVDRHRDDRLAAFDLARVECVDKDVHIGELDGDVSQQAGAVGGGDLQRTAERLAGFDLPARRYPALRLLAVRDVFGNVGAVALVDGNAVAARDIADDVVSRQGVAAVGELDEHIVVALDDHARARLFALDGRLRHHDLFNIGGVALLVLLLETRHDLPQLDAAVADRRIKVLERVVLLFHRQRGEEIRHFFIGQVHALTLELALNCLSALDNIFVALFTLEPLAYLGFCRGGLANIDPGAVGVFFLLGDDLTDLARLERVVDRDDLAVDLGAHHAVTDLRVNEIGEVDGRGALGQAHHVALGRKDVDVVFTEIVADIARDVGGVLRLKLVEDHPLDLLDIAADALAALGVVFHAELVFPVRRDSVFGGVVHLPGADLHLKGDAFGADDGGVDALVHVRLGGGDVILETARNGFEHVVDNTQDIIAVGNGVYDQTEGT